MVFDEIPEGWVSTTLGRITLSVRDVVEPAAATDLPYVGLEHIERGTGRLLGYGKSGDVRSSKLQFREGDVLYGRLRPNLNKVWRADRFGICSTEFEVFRQLDGIDSDFLSLRLRSPDFVAFASSQVGESLYPRVRLQQIAPFKLLLPPRPEQTRIAEQAKALMEQVNDVDERVLRAASRVPSYRRGLLEEGIFGQLTAQWRQQNPAKPDEALAHLASKSIPSVPTDEAVGASPTSNNLFAGVALRSLDLPASWLAIFWRDIGYAQNGRSFPSKEYGSSGARLMRPGNLAPDGSISWSEANTRYLPSAYLDTYPNLLIQPNEVIMNLTAQSLADDFLGRTCLTGPNDQSLLNQRLARLSAYGVIPAYLHYIFRSPHFRRYVDGLATGTVIQHLSTRQLDSFIVPVPPLAEQIEIVRMLDQRLAQAAATEAAALAAAARIDNLRSSILIKAVTGQITVQRAEDGDASKLLTALSNEIELRRADVHAARARRRAKMSDASPPSKSLRDSLLEQSRNLSEPALLDGTRHDFDDVVKLYEDLLSDETLLKQFKSAGQIFRQSVTRASIEAVEEEHVPGSKFRLVSLWIDEFKNLRNYDLQFQPDYAIDIVLGWNGTGKSNLFEALVVIFRDLFISKGKLPATPFGYRIRYQCGGRTVEAEWTPNGRRSLKIRASAAGDENGRLGRITRDELPLPRFVFGYYSGPTNRLAEHFLPLDREHYFRLVNSPSDSPETMVRLLEKRRFFCAHTHHAKYVMLGFFYKEDDAIGRFLRERLRIIGFRSAVFVIKKPDWARPGEDETTFWGATGIVRHFLERLRRISVAPVKVLQSVDEGYRRTQEEQLHFLIPDLDSLRLLAAEYPDARSFFLALESTDFSRMVREVKVSVKIAAEGDAEVPITFREMSEGEQQLLTVLGLLRFTKAYDSLVLLDEPDTHLNPHWAVDYLDLLSRVMGDGEPSEEERSSQILMSTHDPLVIVALDREQIHLLKRNRTTGRCEWEPASEDPRGLGFTGILTSDMFGFGSDLDRPTMDLLRVQARLAGKEGALSEGEAKTLKDVTAAIDQLGFATAVSDPYYRAFLQGVQRRSNLTELMGAEFRDKSDLELLARETDEILAEIEAEEAAAK